MARSAPTTTGRKSVAPPIGCRAVLGAGLAEARQILTHREVAGHADLLAAADAHAVDAADHRLVAGQDGADHVVEQPHVLAVLLRLAGVVLGVLLGVAAGAEGLVARTGEDHAVHRAVVARGAQGQDHALDHVGGVGVELAGVVQRDPGVVQTGNLLAVGSAGGALLVAHAGLVEVVDQVVILEVVAGLGGGGGIHCGSPAVKWRWHQGLLQSVTSPGYYGIAVLIYPFEAILNRFWGMHLS
jgi:hypothetical protein